ncbi:MAG: Unknown protein [uncultured Sulfurovum sp.]|uniref:Uncharacterized protein n=1 Tax=uncultured Sulfurovum sp. TaxID=269237 RepID=A0A6S6T5L4_9BACT|nr:MAG: Unknown protein [uncultured Sulfurovum sp.]
MNEYVKRSDRQYTDIENFRDYEYTECVAFEMAVRASKNLLREMFSLIVESKRIPFNILSSEDRKAYKALKEELLTTYWLRDNYFFNESDLLIYSGQTKIKNIHDLNSAYKFYHISKQFGLYYSFLREEFIGDEVIRPNPKMEFDSWGLSINRGWGTRYRAGDYSTYQIESSRVTSKYDKENSIREIKKCMVRPTLVIPKQFDGSIDIKINPYLPTAETVKFLENALQDIKKGRKARTTYELIQGLPWHEDDFELEPLYVKDDDFKSKKNVADMFYTYDFITKRQEEIEESNRTYKNEYDEEVKNIDSNNGYTYSEKQEQIKGLKEKLNKNLFSNAPRNIIERGIKNNVFSIPISTAMKHYKSISPFIDTMKYKELISGLQL